MRRASPLYRRIERSGIGGLNGAGSADRMERDRRIEWSGANKRPSAAYSNEHR
ncbi:hypothetical protein [Alicyclobacillus acidiphilus]|uniref:hypothetical protein n=1 Tax=Alicyclobacillus acidiphilus TaxID=182455 RepID=UPI000A619CBE|nr:hypothetical protein [Alicyclobacillus acidiphilus]